MKKKRTVRTQLAISMFLLIAISSAVSLTIAGLARNGIIFERDVMRYLVFGYAARDVVLLVVALAFFIVMVVLMSKATTNPIVELNRATKEIADGNFDVEVSLRDRIEEYGELQRNFNLMVKELRSNEYLRKDFISNVSHELKTPLSIMGGYAELLEEGGLSPEEEREYAHLIAAQSRRLISLTGNMLRLSRIDHQEIQTSATRFMLDEQIRQTVLLLEPKWREKDLAMELELPEMEYLGDEELLAQVWLNLLDNAVKFTDCGGTVAVTLKKGAEKLTVTVADTGAGMDEAELSRAFEQFYRGEGSGGSGLGLPLAKRIAELHGGSIEAQSAKGRGSEFTVTLPVEAAEAAPPHRHRRG